jgi:hypothetical protein
MVLMNKYRHSTKLQLKQGYSFSFSIVVSLLLLNAPLNATEKTLTPQQLSEKTEVWEPVPKVVKATLGKPPSDAIILFDQGQLDQWLTLKDGEAPWIVNGDIFTVKAGSGDIKTKQSFCDVQLHLEWRVPKPEAKMDGQQRNNSGVFLQQRYEVQILDSYENKTYSNGQAASIYKQSIPLVNAMNPPGEWQFYDIIFKAPTFQGEQLLTPAFITVLHNGVLVQNHTQIQGKTEWIGAPSYQAHSCAPIQLQDHGNQVDFRNIWVRKLNAED